MAQPKIGLALGSGAARGWSPIGIIEAPLGLGIAPDIVAGTSIGALVGAAFVTGNLGALTRQGWKILAGATPPGCSTYASHPAG
jgi:NTE family protein